MRKSFYQAIKHLEHTNHYSDLYLQDSTEARQIMQEYQIVGERFRDNVTGAMSIDIPFAYEPYWTERQKGA